MAVLCTVAETAPFLWNCLHSCTVLSCVLLLQRGGDLFLDLVTWSSPTDSGVKMDAFLA